MATSRSGYHPFLFLLIGILALVEVGLNAWFVNHFNHSVWPDGRFRSLIIFFLFTACWTALFAFAYMFWILDGALHILASIAGSTIWLMLTALFWVVAAALFHKERHGANCKGTAAVSICREAQAIEAIGWTEFALCIITIFAACFLVHNGRRNPRGAYYV